MKKLWIIFCLFIVLMIFSFRSTNNPYAGEYVNTKNNNILLYLNSNNTFTIKNELDKFSDSADGNYNVHNNKIKLTFDPGNEVYIGYKILNGYVEGTRIAFHNPEIYFSRTAN